MLPLVVIIILFTMPFMYQLVWNVGVVEFLNYLNIAVPTISYGVAFLLSYIITFFFSRVSSNNGENKEELHETLLRAYIMKWILVGLICLISAIIF